LWKAVLTHSSVGPRGFVVRVPSTGNACAARSPRSGECRSVTQAGYLARRNFTCGRQCNFGRLPAAVRAGTCRAAPFDPVRWGLSPEPRRRPSAAARERPASWKGPFSRFSADEVLRPHDIQQIAQRQLETPAPSLDLDGQRVDRGSAAYTS
jgi:hypothetical protein